jgi:hypothetical protein
MLSLRPIGPLLILVLAASQLFPVYCYRMEIDFCLSRGPQFPQWG